MIFLSTQTSPYLKLFPEYLEEKSGQSNRGFFSNISAIKHCFCCAIQERMRFPSLFMSQTIDVFTSQK